MAWIESHPDLLGHPKVDDLRRAMSWDEDQTIGKLHRFWWWCTKYAEDGDLRKHTDERLARAVALNGELEAKRFVDAMVASCWIDRKPYFRVHDWWDYFGLYLQRKFANNPEKWKTIREMYKNCQFTDTKLTPPALPALPALPAIPKSLSPPEASTRSKFVKPEPNDVTAYGVSIGFAVDGRRFCDHYESNGWRVGKTPMRDWKAAVRTWKRNRGEYEVKNAPNGGKSIFEQARQRLGTPQAEGLRKVNSASEILDGVRNVPVPASKTGARQ